MPSVKYEDYADVYERAKRLARARGYKDQAEDFAQEVWIHFQTKGVGKLEWLFIDFLRREYGDTRSSSSRTRIGATNPNHSRAMCLDAPVGESKTLGHDSVRGPSDEPGDERPTGKYALDLRGRDHLVWKMVCLDDMDQEEVAEILGVTAGRICQIVNKIKKRMHEVALAETVGDWYRAVPEYSELKVEWICI